jgi:aminoglycoside 6'-N-acetyltransferase
MELNFRPLEKSDFEQFARWLGKPHVAKWWREPATVEHVAKEYGVHISDDLRTHVYVVQDGQKPIGIIQTFRWSDYPEHADGLPLTSASIDYLIGEEDYVGRGVGTHMIRQFVEQIVRKLYPDASSVATSVEIKNGASLGALRKVGFEPGELITGEYGTPERVMILPF